MTSKPAIVLVTGAFHLASCMDLFSAELKQAGYSTHSIGLTTVDRADHTIKDDVQAIITNMLTPLVEDEGEDIVLFLHSYAGFSGSAAIAGFSKQERSAKGQKGGIIGLIYLCALLPKEGDSQQSLVGGTFPEWMTPDYTTGLISVPNPRQTFYADVPEPLATTSCEKIYPQSMKSFTDPSPAVFHSEDAYANRRVYIRTSNDQALPPFAQDMFLEQTGVQWDIKRMQTAHSPFLSATKELARNVEEILGGW